MIAQITYHCFVISKKLTMLYIQVIEMFMWSLMLLILVGQRIRKKNTTTLQVIGYPHCSETNSAILF